jgi:hypothetical protein
MTEEDIKESQKLVEEMVQVLNRQKALQKRMQDIVVKYQKFIVKNITGRKK